MNDTLLKAERLAKTKGIKGWLSIPVILGLMCVDQFILNIPYANIVFPILVIVATSMNFFQNLTLITAYAVLFELSCIAWFPTRLFEAKYWLIQVFIGFFMPYIVYKAFNPKHKDVSAFTYALYASVGEIFYFWSSVIATVLIWKIPFISYLLSDAIFELRGALATFICAVPVATVYKAFTGEIKLPLKRKQNENAKETAL